MLLPHVSRLCGAPAPLVCDGRATDIVRCWRADRRLARLVGLLGTRPLPPGDALLIPGCDAVHGFGMRFALACLFLDSDARVRRRALLVPGSALRDRRAAAVVECAVGSLPGVGVGARLVRAPDASRPSWRSA